MVRTMPWRKTLGARLGLLSVAILATAILLIVADFRMLGELDAARVETSVLGHRRGEAYRLVALTEGLSRDTGDERARTLGQVADIRAQIEAGPDAGAETLWRTQVAPALDALVARYDVDTLG